MEVSGGQEGVNQAKVGLTLIFSETSSYARWFIDTETHTHTHVSRGSTCDIDRRAPAKTLLFILFLYLCGSSLSHGLFMTSRNTHTYAHTLTR